uniref:VWA domain-containing protein n=1 Tax=candidate division WOR-3 bacterium TaxID=2052148 RepID=A0A7C4GHL9_UNCW3
MIRWARPEFLWALLGLPVAAAIAFLAGRARRRRLHRAVDARLLPLLTDTHSPALARLKAALLFVALALLLVAAARPQWGEKLVTYKGRGVELVIALDASKSMFAQDVKPSRLERAKTELAGLIEELSGNLVGIVAFAGDAHVMCPLTPDVDAARLFLDIISPEAMPVPGTDLGRAIDVAMSLFSEGGAGSRVILLVTDGDDLGRNTPQAVRRAAEAGVRIFPVAFSTPEGAPVPEPTAQGIAYKKDRAGNVVISRMDERALILMAQATGGRFLRVEGFSGQRVRDELDRLQKKEVGGGTFTELAERFQYFLAAAIVLMVVGLGLSTRRGRWW